MLLRYGAKLYIINWRGMTALHEAVLWRRTEMVQFLLGMTGAQLINRVDNEGRTPLWIAALAGNLELVEILYNAGASVDQVGHVGTTALSAAAQGRYSMLVLSSEWMT